MEAYQIIEKAYVKKIMSKNNQKNVVTSNGSAVRSNATKSEEEESSESDSDEFYDEEEMYQKMKDEKLDALDNATSILIEKRLRKWLIKHGKGHLLDF